MAWKARKVAQQTRNLPMDAAAYVDAHLAHVLPRCSFAQIERTVDAARAEFDPAAAEERRLAAAEERHFDVHLRQVSSTGLVDVTGRLDLADAWSLHETIAAKAATLDPELPLDVRRSMAAGMLGADSGVQREVVIYTHAHADTEMVEVENTRTTVTPEQVREWCQSAGTVVTVRPVLDLNENLTTDSYTPTERQQEQVTLTYPRCVFPGCCRPSRRAGQGPHHRVADRDHRVVEPRAAVPLPPPGQDLHRLDLPPHRSHHVRVDQPPRPDLRRRARTDISADHDPADPALAGQQSRGGGGEARFARTSSTVSAHAARVRSQRPTPTITSTASGAPAIASIT